MDRPSLPAGQFALSTKEAARLLRLSHKTLINWRHLKPPKGPPWHAYGRVVRYPLDEFEAWRAKCRMGGES
jgi:hypothetical protein